MISFREPSKSFGRLTLEEAAVLAGVKEKFVRRTLEKTLNRPRRRAGARRFGAHDVLAFRLLGSIPFRMDPKLSKELVRLVTEHRSESGPWAREGTRVVLRGGVSAELELADVLRDVARTIQAYREEVRNVEVNPAVLGGEPVFKGTRIPVRHIGVLVRRGIPTEELLEDYPALSQRQVKFAAMFVALGRPPGRPRKRLRVAQERK